ncbi:hypothetical protein Cs7R123_43480 [Catellatospora sp. TT07R-123]|uniref:hypothetical protein n=1 Tax=Catellatospora sp. TT07R-123 TaxID=2733863 RepID=UPI001B163D93|nr:hypothetical protein [Catellatospora sp. TT07R-123]GHJ47006.1 hypothetical protein Cs7R123_43480 [Catellatospora sp. TT07R-123]
MVRTSPNARPEGRRPRSWGWRVALTAVTTAALLVVAHQVAVLLLYALSVRADGVAAARITLVLLGFAVWVPATRVGYRWRDIVLLLIPFYGLFLALRIVWRCWYLPFADWMPRPEQQARWQQVLHPSEPGELLFVPAGRSLPEG